MITGCGKTDINQSTGGHNVDSQEKNIPFQVLDELSFPPELQEKAQELREQERKGTEIFHDGQNTFILISVGSRNTAGYQIEVQQVIQKGDTLIIQAKEIAPSPDSFTAQVITYPMIGIQIPHSPTIKNIQVDWQ